MRVDGYTQVHGPQGIRPPHHRPIPDATGATQPSRSAGPVDRLEISPAAQEAVRAAEVGDVRQDLVANIRRQIAEGTYETPEKLSRALEGLLDEIG